MSFYADPAPHTEVTEAAEVEDAEAFHSTEIGRVHECGRFWEFERAAFREDHADELGAEITVRHLKRDVEMAHEKSDDAVGVVFAALEHIQDFIFRTVVYLVRYVHPQERAGDITLFPVKAAVNAFFGETGGQRKGSVLPCKAVHNGQLAVKRDGDMGKRFAGKETDQFRGERCGAGKEYVDGLHWNVPVP